MSEAVSKPIALVGGGSGGHIYPLIAVGEQLKKENRPFVFIGEKIGREEKAIKDLGWPFFGIRAGKWRRESGVGALLKNIVDLYWSAAGFFQAIRVLRRTQARIILSKGGYVALPVVWAAKVLGIPVIIHESDAVMGLTNRWSLPVARQVLTNFAPSVFPFSDRRFVRVGLPIRESLFRAKNLKGPRKSRPLVLILPGSQGASAINALVQKSLTDLLAVADVVHMTGEKDFPFFSKLKNQLSPDQRQCYKPFAFIGRELPYYYKIADVVVARASATVIAEAALFEKTLYLIPLPWAASDHQRQNARILAAAKAAVVREQSQLSASQFRQDVLDILFNNAERQLLGQNLSRCFNEGQATTKVLEFLQ